MRRKVAILKTVKVGGAVYKVIYPYAFEDSELVGLCESDRSVIKLSDYFQNTLRSPEKIHETFVHEIVHAIDSTYCGGVLEENEVERMSVILYQVLIENNLILKNCKLPKDVKVGGYRYRITAPYTPSDSRPFACSAMHECLEFRMALTDVNGSLLSNYSLMQNLMFVVMSAINSQTLTPMSFMLGNGNGNGTKRAWSFVSGINQVIIDNDLCKILKSGVRRS